MNLKLTRTDYLSTGIFGIIEPSDDSATFFSLEHAYLDKPEGETGTSSMFRPKVPSGLYECVRGMHRLDGMKEPFETFEITNVPGHTDILFHSGNYNDDSHGCCLIGLSRREDVGIFQSRIGFKKFMEMQSGVNEFFLTVV